MSEQTRRRRRAPEKEQLNESWPENESVTDNNCPVSQQAERSVQSVEMGHAAEMHTSKKNAANYPIHQTVSCPGCGAKVSDKASYCGRCGYVLSSEKKRKRFWKRIGVLLIFVLIFALMLVAFWFMGEDHDNTVKKLVWMINPTMTPAPTATPVVEYVYLTPEPTATPVLTPTPTPVVEYVYLTPEPTATPSPTPTPTPEPVVNAESISALLDDLDLDELLELQDIMTNKVVAAKAAKDTYVPLVEGMMSERSKILEVGDKLGVETPYDELILCYLSIEDYPDYKKDEQLLTLRRKLMEYLFNGKWTDEDGNSMSHIVYYNDYDNTNLASTFVNNLPTSKKSGQKYYYYNEAKDEGYVIGYESQITNDKTDNYLINFGLNTMSVYSYVEDKMYLLNRDTAFVAPAIKDNAKNAYIYIASILGDFYNPRSIRITACEFDSNERVCYFTSSAQNRVGGTVSNTYMVCESSNGYYAFESAHEISVSNVDVYELTNKLQAFANQKY